MSEQATDRRVWALVGGFLAVAGLTLLGGMGLSELFLREVVLPTDNFAKHLALWEAVADRPIRVAGFGDSRLSQGFAPEDPAVVNLAYAGENFEQIAAKLGWFLDRQQPELVILQVAPHMFADYRFDPDRRDYGHYFRPDADWRQRPRLMDPVWRGQLLRYWGLFLTSGGELPNPSRFDDSGAVLVDQVWAQPPSEGDRRYRLTRVAEHGLEPHALDRPTWDRIRATTEAVRARGVRICWVTLPVSPFYREAMDADPETAEALERLAAMAAELGVRYAQDRAKYDDRPELFRNLDHLNATGARIYAAELLDHCGG